MNMAQAKKKTVAAIKSNRSSKLNYRLPAIWDCWGYSGQQRKMGKEIVVDQREYLQGCLDWVESNAIYGGRLSGKSLSAIQKIKPVGTNKVKDGARTRRGGDWIRTQTMYGMIIRCATAWDHDGNGNLRTGPVNEMGTFLKTIMLLPHLKRMGITLLYLLPIGKASNLYRKGELGCPYASKNFFELDSIQFEPALAGDYGDIDDQFRLLVDSAHKLGMRLMLDVAPRTAARDSDWVLDNPEWFYWIDRRFEGTYKSPLIPGVDYINAKPGRLHEIYNVPEVREHLKKFRFAPNVTAPGKWANFVKQARKKPPANLLREISKHFGVTTTPGFSDCINDPQPPWSDVSYLRLFLDHPVESARQLPDPEKQPPYVLFDTAKASLFSGKKPNKKLWDQLAGIIPHYQKMGVDGSRVDMAHALPNALEMQILAKPRKRDKDFCFLAEELGTHLHASLYKSGYNIVIGPSWYAQPRSAEGNMHKMVADIPPLKVPVMAAAETPDTPRSAVRTGGKAFSRQAIVVNNFLPNAVPMIHSGMEVFERQPVNLGLDSTPENRLALPKNDPFAGKLAFFDRFALHWGNAGGSKMIETAVKAAELRAKYLKVLTNRRAYFVPRLTTNKKTILATGFSLGKNKGSLYMLANFDYRKARSTSVAGIGKGEPEVLLQTLDSAAPKNVKGNLKVTLKPGEAMVVIA